MKQSTKQGNARGTSEVRRGTSPIHFHCPAPQSSSHIGHGPFTLLNVPDRPAEPWVFLRGCASSYIVKNRFSRRKRSAFLQTMQFPARQCKFLDHCKKLQEIAAEGFRGQESRTPNQCKNTRVQGWIQEYQKARKVVTVSGVFSGVHEANSGEGLWENSGEF